MKKELTLSNLYFKNYRNLVVQDGVKLNNLNICIGPNGSGKSNLIGVLQFLKESLTSHPNENRGVTRFEDAIQKLGGSNILDKTVEPPAVVQFKLEFNPTDDIPDGIIFESDLMVKGNLENVIMKRESLSAARPLPGQDKPVQYYDKEPVINIMADKTNRKLLTLNEISEFIKTESDNKFKKLMQKAQEISIDVIKVRRLLYNAMSDWYFYNANNMNLESIRNSEPKIGKSDIFLSSSGENLALVLENLTQQDIDFEETINFAMRQILPKTRKIRAIRSGRLSLIIEWYFRDIKQPFYLNGMSDGTVRMLCWAVVLHSPVLPSLLVIEEPEIGIHPAWMRVLADWIKAASQRTQVIISTHHPDLLDHFTDSLENVLCFNYDGKSHYHIKPLSRERLAPNLEQGWQLGDLYRVGDPEVGGWPW